MSRWIKATVFALGLGAAQFADADGFRVLEGSDYLNPGGSTVGEYIVIADSRAIFWGFPSSMINPIGAPWVSDGTASGTAKVADIGGSSSAMPLNQPRLSLGGVAYFGYDNGFNGAQLWRSDATVAGTYALTSIGGGAAGIHPVLAYRNLVFFVHGIRLAVTDGSVAGTLDLAANISVDDAPGAILDDQAIFAGTQSGVGGVVFTDGTAAGTAFLPATGLTGARQIVAVNDVAYFIGTTAASGAQLWYVNDRQASIVMNFPGADQATIDKLTRVDDRLFFTAKTSGAGNELWVSDGSAAGTMLVKDIHSGLQDSSPGKLTVSNGIVYFQADDGTGNNLWRSDGTSAGTYALGSSTAVPMFGNTNDAFRAINHKLVMQVHSTNTFFSEIPYVSDGVTLAPMDPAGQTTVIDDTFVAANGKLLAYGGLESVGAGLVATDAFAALGNTWCVNPELSVPDGNTGGMSSSFHLPSYGGITGLNVSVDIGHTFVGDLTLTLRHEQSGKTVTLLDQPNSAGNCGGALLDIVFDDAATAAAQTSCQDGVRPAYPRDQHFKPVQPLSVMLGDSVAGDWTLHVVDNAEQDFGILHEWCLNFTTDRIFNNQFQ